MKPNVKKEWAIALILGITLAALFAVNYSAVKFLTGSVELFAIVMLAAPLVIVAVSGVLLGLRIKWNWVKGLCTALVLTLVSYGASYAAMTATADDMQVIYDELDTQEGGEIYSEVLISDNGSVVLPDGVEYGDGEIVVTAQKADSSSELLGNVITFLIALGGSFAGGKIKEKAPAQGVS